MDMIPRIKKLETRDEVGFDSGETVVYDVNDDILNIPDFSVQTLCFTMSGTRHFCA